MEAFLEINSNKTELIKYLTERWCSEAPKLLRAHQCLVIGGGKSSKTVMLTKMGENVIPELAADLEEADPRLLLHMKHALEVDKRKYGLFIASDTDIAVIAIGALCHMRDCQLYQCINHRLVPLHLIHSTIGPVQSSALVAFHALTGCDTNGYLSCRKSKKGLWEQACQDADVIQGMSTFGTGLQPPTSIPDCSYFLSYLKRMPVRKEPASHQQG